MKAFAGEPVDRIPFMHYQGHLPRGAAERELRNRGFGFCWMCSPLVIETPDVRTTTYRETREGRVVTTTVHTAPAGEVSESVLSGGGYGSRWGSLPYEHLIRKPADYDVVESILADERLSVNHELIEDTVADVGEDGVVMSWMIKTPLMDMLYRYLGPEAFAVEYHENRERFLRFFAVLEKRFLRMCELLADSAVEFFELGDNVTADMVGRERFDELIVPVWRKVCEVFHARGKKVGSHLDGNLRLLKDAIGKSDLDFIDAYTPPPDTDLPLKEARRAWPGKVIIINFPSSQHLLAPGEIRKAALRLAEDAFPGDRFMINVTENVPPRAWSASAGAINDALIEYGPVPK